MEKTAIRPWFLPIPGRIDILRRRGVYFCSPLQPPFAKSWFSRTIRWPCHLLNDGRHDSRNPSGGLVRQALRPSIVSACCSDRLRGRNGFPRDGARRGRLHLRRRGPWSSLLVLGGFLCAVDSGVHLGK